MDSRTKPTLAPVTFTYDWYRGFLDWLQETGFTFRTVSEGVESGTVLLRHDVDLSLQKALTTARIEAERGVSATYCVLLTSPLYNPFERSNRERLHAIEALGHEVGLHCSTHEYWDADNEPTAAELHARVEQELTALGTTLSTTPEAVSFHVPPEWVLGRPFDAFENTYGPAFFEDIAYVADSGQRWRETPPSIPDPPASAQVLTHPGLYGETDSRFETRVEQSVTEACRHADRKAHLEFLSEVDDA
ncbi:MAG: hypothetical protein ABEI98_11925 [Halorhabdus sp.]